MATTILEMEFRHFSNRVGKSFRVTAQGHQLALTLDAAQELPGSPRIGGAFRLEFVGPPETVLAQGMFPFEIDADRFEIFVVLIGHDARGARYEAVFF